MITVVTSVIMWFHHGIHHWPAAVGPGVGAIGILVAIIAHRRAARAVAECAALVNGSVGSRGTVDPRALRDLAIVRYDALSEMSGQLSFSVAVLNALGDGVVLSSINGRSETRTYAKVVRGGLGAQPLSPEEEHAVRSARLGKGLPTVEHVPAADMTVRTRRPPSQPAAPPPVPPRPAPPHPAPAAPTQPRPIS